MYPEIASGGKTKKFSVHFARNIVLHPILKMMALPVIATTSLVHLPVTVAPKNFGRPPPIGVVWPHACV